MSANGYAAQTDDGQAYAKKALVLGIIGLFILGIVFGPFAIGQANKAEALGVKATGGKVLGWIDTIFGAIATVYLVLTFA